MNVTMKHFFADPAEWLESEGFTAVTAWKNNVIVYDDGINVARVECINPNNYVVKIWTVGE
jgi:hypothetical protein